MPIIIFYSHSSFGISTYPFYNVMTLLQNPYHPFKSAIDTNKEKIDFFHFKFFGVSLLIASVLNAT
jgi:hypothetical protein